MTEQRKYREQVQTLALDFIGRTGMAPADFARRVGYAYSTVQLFLTGKYAPSQTDMPLCAAILQYFEHNPLASPDEFLGTIHETSAVNVMRMAFQHLLERPGIYMVYAPPGSGKTDIARHLISEHNAKRGAMPNIFRIYCRARITPRDLMRRVAFACGSTPNTSIERTIANLRYDFKGQRAVLYFDEAQRLSLDCFETARELLDEEPRFSLCFAGSHDLEKIFSGFVGTMEQLERRITDKVRLPALTREEAITILNAELAEFIPSLDPALLQQQIDLATISVRVEKKTQRYISVGRLIATAREVREVIAARSNQDEKEAAPALEGRFSSPIAKGWAQ
jgi:type II secretory pathway predicted ATPase ExeA